MSNQVIIYPQPNGVIASIWPSPEYLKDHTIQELASKDVPAGVIYQIVLDSDFPAYPSFYNAFETDFKNYQGINVNLDKAKVIYKQTADTRAAELSQPLTQEYMRLLAIGGDTTAVQAQLQVINAAAEETAYLDATSVDALIACWPPELGPNPFLPVSSEAE
jgi:hypothetical protein